MTRGPPDYLKANADVWEARREDQHRLARRQWSAAEPAWGIFGVPEWPDDPTVTFHLGHGDWVRLLRSNSFVVEDLIEIWPPDGTQSDYAFVTAEWARQWPSDEVWRARRQ